MKLPISTLFPSLKQVACLSVAIAALGGANAFGQTIFNPSFEANTFTSWPGYIAGNPGAPDNGPITDWVQNGDSRVGLNPAGGSPFADNGAIPNGNNVAFIQSDEGMTGAGTPPSLSAIISGLTPGTLYQVTFRANARATQNPFLQIQIDGANVLAQNLPALSLAAVNAANPYWYISFEFTAAAESQVLSLANTSTGDNTVVVDDFQIAPSEGRWTVQPWTGDGDMGVDPTFYYTHAFNFGTGVGATINGVPFTGIPGGNPAVAGSFSSTYLANVFNGDANSVTAAGGGSAPLATDFVYGGNVPAGLYQSVTLEGLTPGTEYIVTIYSMGWENPSAASRWATFSMGSDHLTLNQDTYGDNNGITISYRYTADASGTATIKFAPLAPANVSFHTYGFSNREAVSRFVAPSISIQPRSTTVSDSLPVTFSVAGNGLPTPTYQWRYNGQEIPGAMDVTYTIGTATALEAGDYDVVVANAIGSVTSVVARLTVGIPMVNPSFEVDSFVTEVGYVSQNSQVTGWTTLANFGINPIADGRTWFADNGTIPQGRQVLFMQGDGALSQTVSGLTVGSQYYIHYYENSRNCCNGTAPHIEVKIGGETVVPAHAAPPVLGSNPYHDITSALFTATATDMLMEFIKSNPEGGDTTALIDNIAIVLVESGMAPLLSLQPVSRTVYINQAVNFSTIASGTEPLSYQWLLNGQPIVGATTNTYSIAAVRLSDEGNYTVVVTNLYGFVTSAVARLALLETITSLHSTGLDANNGPVTGGELDPFWVFLVNPDLAVVPGDLTNATVSLDVWPVGPAWTGNSATSKWIGPRANLGPADIGTGDYLYRTTFDLTGRDPSTVIINGQWESDNGGTAVYLNGATLAIPLSTAFNGWTAFTITTNTATFLPGTNTLDFGVNNAGAGPTGLRVEFTSSSARTLPGVPASVAAAPQGGKITEGDSFTFNVVANGTLPIGYQWFKDGVLLPGKTDQTLTIANATVADSGDYSVTVSNLWAVVPSASASLCVCWKRIPGIFGTGLADDFTLLPDGAVDPHYLLLVSADPNFPGPEAYTITNAWPIQAGTWVVNGPASRWIGAGGNQQQNLDPLAGNAGGDYTFEIQFDLTGYDVNTVELIGAWATDNVGTDLRVNGLSTGLQNTAQFPVLTPFTLTVTNGLQNGLNTIDFVVNNAAAGPTGLRVDLKGRIPSDVVLRPRITVTRTATEMTISWPTTAGSVLQSTDSLTTPNWQDVQNATSPYTVTTTGAGLFYRVVVR